MTTYSEMYLQAKKGKAVKKIDVDYVKFEKPNTAILGRFIEKTEVESSTGGGFYNQYLFETDEGIKKFALGKAADAEIGSQFKKEHIYKVTYKGKQDIGSGRRVNLFDCEVITMTSDDMTTIPEDK